MIDYSSILLRNKPDEGERERIRLIVLEVGKRISEYCRNMGIDADPVLVGSAAKGTNLKSADIDIFVRFSRLYKEREMEKMGVSIGKLIIEDGVEKYAEHPYVTGHYKGFKMDIVPSYRLNPGEKKISSVDRTPLHTEFVLRNLSEGMKDEVILLKLFMKHFGIYGSEVKVSGFSGYVCELLVWKYGSFENVVRKFAELSGRLMVGEVGKNNIPESPVFIVDPVDSSRNAAAALSEESLSTMKVASKLFLFQPNASFFDQKKMIERPKYADRGTAIRVFTLPRPDVVDDTIFPQAVKFRNSLLTLLESGGFHPLSSEIATDGQIQVLIECRNPFSPEIIFKEGPPADSPNVIDFIEKYRCTAERGPYIRGNRIWVEVRALPESIADFVSSHIDELSIGKNLSRLKEGLEIHDPLMDNIRMEVLDRFYSKRII
ncbi:MAG: CCA tRNA nucleotidyltransferase [Thermoplasmataceae archaeon]